MPTTPNMPDTPGGGWRQQQAARLRADAQAAESAPCAEQNVGRVLADDRRHCVQEGESLDRIANSYDCPAEAIWNHPKNDELRTQRGGAESLASGDNLYIPTEGDQPPQPVGQGEHVVRDGECIASIAKDTGHFWETLWNDPANAELKEVRGDPNVVLPGDRVTIPETSRKEEDCETEQRHRFVRRGEPSCLEFRLSDRGKRLTNEEYLVEVDGVEQRGVSDANGCVRIPIPGNACRAVLCLRGKKYPLRLGRLDPATTQTGMRDRLNNLGYDAGEPGSGSQEELSEAITCFQSDHQLPMTGNSDDATMAKLRQECDR